MNQNRSLAVAAGVIGAVAIALICAFTLPAASSKSGFGSLNSSLSEMYRDPGPTSVRTFMVIAGLDMALMALAGIGGGFTSVSSSTSGSPEGDRRTQAIIVTFGALMALSLLAYLQYKLSDAASQARASGSNVTASIGTGLILASIAVVIGAVIPWGAVLAPSAGGGTQATGPSLTADLERLDVMRRDGALTEAEFQTAKERLLQ